MKTATSLAGYKHTDEAKLELLKIFKDKSNHPKGKSHKYSTRQLISKLGQLNPMFGKQHSEITKEKISDIISRHLNGVDIYDLNDSLISKFKNNI